MHRASLRVVFVLLFIISGLLGQSLSIQGVARDNTGQSLPDASYAFTFRLYVGSTGGIVDWSEVQTLPVLNGVFSAILGDVTSMAGLDFNEEYWLSLEIDGNGELDPRTKLILSPYAIMAEQIGSDNYWPLSGNVGIGTTAPHQTLSISGGIGFANHYEVDKKLYSPADGELEWMTNNAAGSHAFSVSHLGAKKVSLNTYGNSYLNGGNVGIGTEQPTAKLHVNGNIKIPTMNYGIKNSSANGNFILQTGRRNGTFYDYTAIHSGGLEWDANYEPVSVVAAETGLWVTKATTAGEPFGQTLLRVGTNGLMGIRIESPSKPLHIEGSGYYNPIRIDNAQANSSEANAILATAPDHTLLMGGVWGGNIYFYWKSFGVSYHLDLAGSVLSTTSQMGGDDSTTPEERLSSFERRIETLEKELAETKALLNSK